jgi:hypothetical protein
MFAWPFGKAKDLEDVTELDVPVSQARPLTGRAPADGYLRPARWTSTSLTRHLLARVKCNMMLSTRNAFSGHADTNDFTASWQYMDWVETP